MLSMSLFCSKTSQNYNTYGRLHDQRPKGQQKRINRELAGLFMKGMTGNGEKGGERGLFDCQEKYVKHYYNSGALAAKAYNHDPGQDVYWWRGKTVSRHFRVWQVIPASEY